jgi:hypothetical protein
MVNVIVNNINGAYVRTFELDIYDLDTQKSAITRLASEMKTIPRYLYFPKGVPSLEQLNKEYSITVEDLLENIISEDKEDLDFVTFANSIKGKLDQQNLNLRDDVLLPFVAYDSSIAIDQRNVLHALSDTIERENLFEVQSVESLLRDLRNFWENDRNQTIERFTKKIKDVQKEASEQKKRYEDFDKVSKIRYTTFEQESVTFEFSLDLVDITIMEIFNHVRLNSVVPFATIDNFFKIFNDFNPPKTWKVSTEKGIIFKVLQKKIPNRSKYEDYIEGLLVVDGEPGKENVIVEMSLLTLGNFLQRDEMIKRFLTSIYGLGNIDVKNITEKSIKGSFYFPNHSLNRYVFADLLMNNELFSSMMSIDEREKATKKKESIYIHFYNSKIGKLTANITEKISVRNDSDLRGKDVNEEFKFGSTYIRVKIVIATNIQAVLIFQDLFSKLLAIYDEKYPEIIAFYEKYTPITRTEKEKDKVQPVLKTRLKDIAPEVFVSGYSQKCGFPPTIIDDNDHKGLEEAKQKGLQIMRYPKDDDEQKDDKLFPSRNYVCNNPKVRFPGLHENQFEKNKDMVPYLPCCFKKDNNKPNNNSLYRQYFYGEEQVDKTITNQQDLITSKKFAAADRYGTLPVNLNKMFNIFDYDEDYIYVRKGVNYSKGAKSSFLECVMEGMYKETGILNSTDREAFLAEKRYELATDANAAACSQEMYDYTLSEIINIIQDSSIYMEPSLFSSLLEQHFNCNIFVFSRSDNNTNMNIPRHIHAYYKNKRENAKCIFIYEHKGSSADKEKGTRCELIVKWEKRDKDNVSYYYPYTSKVSKGVRNLYMSMIKSYALKDEIVESSIPKIINTKKVKFLEQGLDSYGKCRMLRFSIDSSNVTILTDPLQPFVISAAINWVATKTTKETAIKLANAIGIQFSSQCIKGGVLKEIYGKFGDVNITIPVVDTDKMNLPEDNDRIIIQTGDSSSLSNYNEYKKLSRYVVEYMLWLFSKYLNEDSETPSAETIDSFVKNKLKIIPDFKYGKVKTIFSETSGVMKQGKLIVKSEETLKRLVYILRLSLRRFREKIERYHESKTIENFYLDVTDFDQYPRQVILYGKDSIDKWNNEKNNKHVIYDSVQFDINVPYFFKNGKVKSGTVFLAQNTHTLQKAMEIGETWVKSGFNVDGEANGDRVASFEFKLYRYINSNDIVLYNVEGTPNSFKIRVLGWKYEGKSSFAVLLPL